MNVVSNTHHDSVSSGVSEPDFDFDQLIKAARRQVWLILAFCAIGVAGGLAYIAQSVPRYTATSILIIDSAKDKSTLSASIADLTYDSGAIDSQLEVLKSEGTASSVLSTLKLAENSEFTNPPTSALSRWSDRVRSALRGRSSGATETPLSEQAARNKVRQGYLDQLESSLAVRRVGRSYVIDVDYTSTDPELAALIANGFAQAYVGDQLAAKFNAMQQTKEWLEKRILEFRTKWTQSDLDFQKRRSELGLITTDGHLIGEQQLSQISMQLTTAQGETARTQARYTQLQQLVAAGDVDSVVSDTLANPMMSELRANYQRAVQVEKQVFAGVGADQPQAVALRNAKDNYKAQILAEMSRLADAYKSDAEVAEAKEQRLRDTLSNLAKQNSDAEQRLVGLRIAEGEVNNNRKIYEELLQRYQDVQEHQAFPEAEARIITSASPPASPAYPKRPVVTMLSLVFGLLAGVGGAVIRENRDRVFRTASDTRTGLRLDFLGMLPLIKLSRPEGQGGRPLPEPGQISQRDPLMRYSLDHPFSSFSETLQSMKVAADLRLDPQGGKVIGILSVAPDEGKTTIAKNFASLLGRMGASVILIDGDLHQRGLTNALAPNASDGLLEVLRGKRSLVDCLQTEQESGLAFLPTTTRTGLVHSSHVLSSPKMRDVIAEARTMFDYVVVDLPPVGPVVGVRAAASFFDGLIVVVEWGRTAQAMLKNTILSDSEIVSKCLGVVYNKVRMQKIKLYEGLGSNAFHHEEFGDYLKSGFGKDVDRVS